MWKVAFLLLFSFLFGSLKVNAMCTLPHAWSGKWFQSKDLNPANINRTNFLTRGVCIEHKQDKFLFYESKEDCYRCVFIMQKHVNVLQYRATYCTEQNDFYSNCQNLSPESELITVYRENSATEKCPLNGLYVLSQPTTTIGSGPAPVASAQNFDRTYRSSGTGSATNKCVDESSKDSMIMECSDQSMLKLQFGKCTSMPTFIINCIAHWSEGNSNYLIGRIESNDPTVKPTYKCIVYSESSSSSSTSTGGQSSGHSAHIHRHHKPIGDQFRHARHKTVHDEFVDLSNGDNNNIELYEKSNLQISISSDEFCRSVDSMDEQFSFTFSRVYGSRYHVAPPVIVKSKRNEDEEESVNNKTRPMAAPTAGYDSLNRNYIVAQASCKFPKWLNRKWYNFKQTKSFTLDYRLDSLFVYDEKNAIIINKYTCAQMKTKKSNHIQAVVKSLNGCSSGYQCVTINSKSDYVLEIKFGKISYESASSVKCGNDEDMHEHDYISQEYVYVDTNYGVKCPLKTGVYEKLNPKVSNHQKHQRFSSSSGSSEYSLSSSQSLSSSTANEPCKYLTQTQTLQVGCQNEQQYSLRTKLCYPNHQYNGRQYNDAATSADQPKQQPHHHHNQQQPTTTAYTQLESEINLVCLAHWRHNNHHVIVSRTMSNEILCSIWSSSDDGRLLQLIEIDSNCNYEATTGGKQHQQQRINYGFMYIGSCNGIGNGDIGGQSKSSPFAAAASSSSISSGSASDPFSSSSSILLSASSSSSSITRNSLFTRLFLHLITTLTTSIVLKQLLT